MVYAMCAHAAAVLCWLSVCRTENAIERVFSKAINRAFEREQNVMFATCCLLSFFLHGIKIKKTK